MATEKVRLAGTVSLFGVYSQGSGVAETWQYSTLGLWGVIGSAVVIGFLSVPVK